MPQKDNWFSTLLSENRFNELLCDVLEKHEVDQNYHRLRLFAAKQSANLAGADEEAFQRELRAATSQREFAAVNLLLENDERCETFMRKAARWPWKPLEEGELQAHGSYSLNLVTQFGTCVHGTCWRGSLGALRYAIEVGGNPGIISSQFGTTVLLAIVGPWSDEHSRALIEEILRATPEDDQKSLLNYAFGGELSAVALAHYRKKPSTEALLLLHGAEKGTASVASCMRYVDAYEKDVYNIIKQARELNNKLKNARRELIPTSTGPKNVPAELLIKGVAPFVSPTLLQQRIVQLRAVSREVFRLYCRNEVVKAESLMTKLSRRERIAVLSRVNDRDFEDILLSAAREPFEQLRTFDAINWLRRGLLAYDATAWVNPLFVACLTGDINLLAEEETSAWDLRKGFESFGNAILVAIAGAGKSRTMLTALLEREQGWLKRCKRRRILKESSTITADELAQALNDNEARDILQSYGITMKRITKDKERSCSEYKQKIDELIDIYSNTGTVHMKGRKTRGWQAVNLSTAGIVDQRKRELKRASYLLWAAEVVGDDCLADSLRNRLTPVEKDAVMFWKDSGEFDWIFQRGAACHTYNLYFDHCDRARLRHRYQSILCRWGVNRLQLACIFGNLKKVAEYMRLYVGPLVPSPRFGSTLHIAACGRDIDVVADILEILLKPFRPSTRVEMLLARTTGGVSVAHIAAYRDDRQTKHKLYELGIPSLPCDSQSDTQAYINKINTFLQDLEYKCQVIYQTIKPPGQIR